MAYKSTRRKTGSNSTETKTYSTKGGTRHTRTTKINGVTRSVSWSTKNPSKTKRTRTQRSGIYTDRRSNTTGPRTVRSSGKSGDPAGAILLIFLVLVLGLICYFFTPAIPYVLGGIVILFILWWAIRIFFMILPWFLLSALVAFVAYLSLKIAAFF